MAYFPNGTTGMDYMEHFCCRCVNFRDKNDGRGPGCPIMDLHTMWNYEAIGKDADKIKADALNHFIPVGNPETDGDSNGECEMFLPDSGDVVALRNLEVRKLAEWEKIYGKRTCA